MWISIFLLVSIVHCSSSRSFTIDWENDVFLKDGKPFRYISGSFHYFRVPRVYWKDRMTKMRAAGLNTLQTYVAWNMHEAQEGKYNFNGSSDLASFIQMAQSAGLLVIVRAGPYICAEWDLGGFPPWLLRNYTTARLRSSLDKGYIAAVDRWMSVLLPILKPLLYVNGGPIIAVQIENEYGSYFTCDHQYMTHLQAVFEEHLGKDVILFTTDGFNDRMLECGSLPTLFTTVDFGAGVDPAVPFSHLRKYQPKGPLVNSEFYPGWLDHWAERHQTREAAAIGLYLDKILAMNASVNLYMFEGGTSFGFMNGANGYQDSRKYQPQPTSYDYDAPLTEAGDPTTKYFVIMETIAKYATVPPGPVPVPTKKYAYGKVMMSKLSSIFDVLKYLTPLGPVNSTDTLTMEQIGLNYGFMLYRTKIPFSGAAVNISIPGLRDRGIVFVNQVRQATLIRVNGKTSATIKVEAGAFLDILVENMGRINYGPHLQDPKGILGDVTLNNEVLKHWMMYPLHFDEVVGDTKRLHTAVNDHEASVQIPSFYTGHIPPAPDGIPKDTFLKLPGWFKGQAFVNGFNIGRYWPVVGPQITLYVPENVLRPGKEEKSELVLLELDNAPCESPENCFVEFVDKPEINGAVHPMEKEKMATKEVELNKDWTSKYRDFLPRNAKTKQQTIDLLKSWP
ncbi:hypothetical protein ACROYT_G024779 [Oculina patagonica]